MNPSSWPSGGASSRTPRSSWNLWVSNQGARPGIPGAGAAGPPSTTTRRGLRSGLQTLLTWLLLARRPGAGSPPGTSRPRSCPSAPGAPREEDASGRARWARSPGSRLTQDGRPRPSRRARGCSGPRGARWSACWPACWSAAGRRPRWCRSGSPRRRPAPRPRPPRAGCWRPERARTACTRSARHAAAVRPRGQVQQQTPGQGAGRGTALPPLYPTRPLGRSRPALPHRRSQGLKLGSL